MTRIDDSNPLRPQLPSLEDDGVPLDRPSDIGERPVPYRVGEEEGAILAALTEHGYDFDFFHAVRLLENARARWVEWLKEDPARWDAGPAETSPGAPPSAGAPDSSESMPERTAGGFGRAGGGARLAPDSSSRRQAASLPKAVRVGHSTRASDDPVRFSQNPSLAFAPATVQGVRPRPPGPLGESGPPRLFVHFLGLLGPNGPMPLHLTEYARDRELHHDDPTFARFLDIFNHRIISLFYRAWAVSNKVVHYERGEEDRFSLYISSLFGLGFPSLAHRDSVADDAKRYFSGHLSCQTRHPEGLAHIVQEFFQVPAQAREFIGIWMDLPREYQCRLGESPQTGQLGRSAIVGSRTWEPQHKFRLRLGPMKFDEYVRLLPGGDSLRRLVDWVRLYLNDELQWDAQLVLSAAEVPVPRLGATDGSARLGYSTWLHTRPLGKDADDLVLNPV